MPLSECAGCVRLTLTWPGGIPEETAEDFLLGVWSPEIAVEVDWTVPPRGITVAVARGANYALLSNTVLAHCGRRGLVHAMPGGRGAVGFRGYLFDPPLTSWSPSQEVVRYWQAPSLHTHNGVFAAALIRGGGRSLELVADALGVSPMYYRVFEGMVIFASSSRWMRMASDAVDRMAARILLQTGYIPGRRSLVQGVQRIAAGSVTTFAPPLRAEEKRWFALAPLARGARRIDAGGVAELEASFQHAIDRCLRLPADKHFLPLSSGDDSRRFLAALYSRRVPFQSATTSVINTKGRDLDGPCAAAIARDLGFPHELLELSGPEAFAAEDRQCRLLLAAETIDHAWMLPLLRGIPKDNVLVYDGLAGDLQGNGGYFMLGGGDRAKARDLLLQSAPEQVRLAARALAGNSPEGLLRLGAWPSLEDVCADLAGCIELLPEGPNRLLLAVMMVRPSRSTGLWSQHLLQAGQIPVHPYLELDHLRTTFAYSPFDKIETSVQARCLSACWPDYYAYPGTRRPPEKPAMGDLETDKRRRLARLTQLRCDMGSARLLFDLRPLLQLRAYAAVVGAASSVWVAQRIYWWLAPLLTGLAHSHIARPCWSLTRDIPASRGPDPRAAGGRL